MPKPRDPKTFHPEFKAAQRKIDAMIEREKPTGDLLAKAEALSRALWRAAHNKDLTGILLEVAEATEALDKARK